MFETELLENLASHRCIHIARFVLFFSFFNDLQFRRKVTNIMAFAFVKFFCSHQKHVSTTGMSMRVATIIYTKARFSEFN